MLLIFRGEADRHEFLRLIERCALLVTFQKGPSHLLVLNLIYCPHSLLSSLADDQEFLACRDANTSDALSLIHS